MLTALPAEVRPAALRLPPSAGGLSRNRRLVGLTCCVLGLPALTGLLAAIRTHVSLSSVLLSYLLAVVLIAVVGGVAASLVAAVASFLMANWFFTVPYYTFAVAGQDDVIALVVFIVVAALVSVTVDLGARNQRRAERSRMEARLLSGLTSGEVGHTGVEGVLDLVRGLFTMRSVALAGPDGLDPLAYVGQPPSARPALVLPAGDRLSLLADGPDLGPDDELLLRTLATAAGRVWGEQRLGEQAARARELAETDRVRSALLAAVGHDLRTPLAGIKAAVSSLRQTDLTWTPEEREELLATVEESADRLNRVISNLLAMSRIQAGAVSVRLGPVALDEVVAAALLSLGQGDALVDVPEDLPPVLADPGLAERVLANLVSNARRFTAPGTEVSIRARRSTADAVRLAVVDHGPGVPEESWQHMFTPFGTLPEGQRGSGLGMGLAIARGLSDAMGVSLTPEHTPGGGLTMVLDLPVAR